MIAALERAPAGLSVVTYWEVIIKSIRGSLSVVDPRLWFAQTLDALGLQPLLFRPEHIGPLLSG
jgi:PIN domain nuclease of toxin-antitoxin system